MPWQISFFKVLKNDLKITLDSHKLREKTGRITIQESLIVKVCG